MLPLFCLPFYNSKIKMYNFCMVLFSIEVVFFNVVYGVDAGQNSNFLPAFLSAI